MNERDGKTIQPTVAEHYHTNYRSVGLKSSTVQKDRPVFDDKSRLTLGQMLCHCLEKALNIQYMDFKGKLKPEHQRFFF